ncbi:MAG TPA: hypothetical protein PL056_10580 [bacterium]|nr:hypothetical protein [bacterium]
MSEKKVVVSKTQDVLITFLKEVQDGVYAPVEKSSLPYSRMSEQAEDLSCSEEYIYSIR